VTVGYVIVNSVKILFKCCLNAVVASIVRYPLIVGVTNWLLERAIGLFRERLSRFNSKFFPCQDVGLQYRVMLLSESGKTIL